MKAYKTEIHCTDKQKSKIVQAIGVCRFLYNAFLAHNQAIYKTEKRFVSGFEFDKYVNRELSLEKPWIKEVSSKARKQAIMNADGAFKRFFKGQSKFPRFKKKNKQQVGIYFPKNNPSDLKVERHRIKVPTLGWVRLKEKAYIPPNAHIGSLTITQKGDRFFLSALIKDEQEHQRKKKNNFSTVPYSEGIGLDVGLKNFAITSNGRNFKNINKSSRLLSAEKKLKREQRALSRKYEYYKTLKKSETENSLHNQRKNVKKNITRIQNLHRKLTNMRHAYLDYVIREVTKTKPLFITVEKLNIRGMMKNKHRARSIANQCFYEFKLKLIRKCQALEIELREVDTFYPSSKLCSCCGVKKVKLSLSERTFTCDHCGHTQDRDENATHNLAQANDYVVIT